MRGPRGRYLGRQEERAAQKLADIRGDLHGIIEIDLVEPVEPLALDELVELERQGGLMVERPIAARRSFQVQSNVGELSRAVLHRGMHELAIVLAKLLEILVVERDREMGDRPGLEERCRL